LTQHTTTRVAIVGGGLAGLAAACVLADAGLPIDLFERKPFLGGRASSYEHPGTGEVVDNCQHVLLGCCTNLVDFYRRIGSDQLIRWYNRLTFIEPGGRRSAIAASSVPAPFHTSPTFLRAHALTLRDKLAIARAMLSVMPARPADNGQNFKQWLKSHGQTDQAIRRFWEPVLVSALNEDADRLSVAMAGMVFRDAFLKSAEAGRMGLPTVPLTELYSRAGQYIEARGGRVHLRASIDSLEDVNDFDYVILAVPVFSVPKLLPNTPEFAPIRDAAAHFEPSPITGIHLWFDREITELEHAVLLDRTIQWMFHKSRILSRYGTRASETPVPAEVTTRANEFEVSSRAREGSPALSSAGEVRVEGSMHFRPATGSYVELVISSSKSLLDKPRQEIIDLAVRELAEFFPIVRAAKLVKATVVKEVHATFSPRPGIDQFRPAPNTANPRLFLAGDWVATGWPATMEGAVRSGYLAAEALLQSLGDPRTVLVPDLPARGLMRLFP
jgi:squalene-associated FAD-dependent desaturase